SDVYKRQEYIYEATLRVFSTAEQRGITPHDAAMRLAEERIRAISTLRTRSILPTLSLSTA
ncbi:MAG: hypothetical protein N2170_06745, partial [Bacteroidia bacterium]|nr:hypothetical protein [Bacteroidia bacterium]